MSMMEATFADQAAYDGRAEARNGTCVDWAAVDGSGAPAVYVGETDALRGRLARHDATYGARSPALVVALGDKSASRKLEAAVIRRLRRGGVPLLSTDDGAHVAFGGAA